jgi:hypothetical protein
MRAPRRNDPAKKRTPLQHAFTASKYPPMEWSSSERKKPTLPTLEWQRKYFGEERALRDDLMED